MSKQGEKMEERETENLVKTIEDAIREAPKVFEQTGLTPQELVEEIARLNEQLKIERCNLRGAKDDNVVLGEAYEKSLARERELLDKQ
jgi:hypothetical protein